MRIVRANNAPGFGRDPETGAIININSSEVNAARKAKERRLKQKEEMNALKQDVSDIKAMLNQLIEKL